MPVGTDLATVAALIGDPARANMLAALMDGRALTATELAFHAGIRAPTASGHLAKLTEGRLLSLSRQGRHRYFALASPDVARMLEVLLVMAGAPGETPLRATPRIPPDLAACRSCYDHLAGRLAVAIADTLAARGAIRIDAETCTVTAFGHALFARCGIGTAAVPHGRRLLCRPCLDWSERRPHLAGRLGAHLLDLSLARGWVERKRDSRALAVTARGRTEFGTHFGVGFGADGSALPGAPTETEPAAKMGQTGTPRSRRA